MKTFILTLLLVAAAAIAGAPATAIAWLKDPATGQAVGEITYDDTDGDGVVDRIRIDDGVGGYGTWLYPYKKKMQDGEIVWEWRPSDWDVPPENPEGAMALQPNAGAGVSQVMYQSVNGVTSYFITPTALGMGLSMPQ